MPSKDYQIVFRGRLAPDQDLAQVKENLARLFKVDAARIEQMFSGQRQVLKKGLDRDTADKYRTLLKKAGAIVAVVSEETQRSAHESVAASAPAEAAQVKASFAVDDPAQGPTKSVFAVDDPAAGDGQKAAFAVDDPTAAAATRQATESGAAEDPLLAPVGEQIIEQQVFKSLDFDIAGLTVAATGEVMDSTPRPPPAAIDTSDLVATEEYEALDPKPSPPPPQIDTTDLTIAEGDTVADPEPAAAPPKIDTSGLSASNEYEALDNAPAASAPEIDTSHLKVE